MKTALLALLGSKKTLTYLLGLLTSLGAFYGFDVDPQVFWAIVGLTAVLLGAQGLTDVGKAKAEIETRHIQSGHVHPVVMIALAVIGVACIVTALVGCGPLKRETKGYAGDVVDCMKPELREGARELVSVLDVALVTLLSDTGKVDRNGFKAVTRELKSDAAGCAIAAAVKRLSAPRGQDSQASPLAVDVADLTGAWDDVRREKFGGRTFAVGAGT